MACVCRRKSSAQSENEPQHLELEQPHPHFTKTDFDQLSVYDDILLDLDNETAAGNPYDALDGCSFYDELADGKNETYDHPGAVARSATPNPYEALHVPSAAHDHPSDDAPALPDRPPQDTSKPSVSPIYLELINVDEGKNESAEC